MNKFDCLDKVVCVRPGDPENGLVKGKMYTITNCFKDAADNDAVEVLEVKPPLPLIGYLAFRFEKVIGNEVLTEELEEVL